MEANIIIEINSGLDNKQNAEIRQILQNVFHNFSIIYCMKMLIKVNEIHAVSFDIHLLFLIVISRLYSTSNVTKVIGVDNHSKR